MLSIGEWLTRYGIALFIFQTIPEAYCRPPSTPDGFQSNILECVWYAVSVLNHFIWHNTQVHPLSNSESQNPQEIINIAELRSNTGNSHGTERNNDPAFVVELFLRENPDVRTIQPGQEQENMVCFSTWVHWRYAIPESVLMCFNVVFPACLWMVRWLWLYMSLYGHAFSWMYIGGSKRVTVTSAAN